MKKLISILCALIITTALAFPVTAHPGRTDSNGGHYNRATGEYHYHDGSSAGKSSGGSSINGLPDLYRDKTDYPSYSSKKSESSKESENSEGENSDFGAVFLILFIIGLIIYGIYKIFFA